MLRQAPDPLPVYHCLPLGFRSGKDFHRGRMPCFQAFLITSLPLYHYYHKSIYIIGLCLFFRFQKIYILLQGHTLPGNSGKVVNRVTGSGGHTSCECQAKPPRPHPARIISYTSGSAGSVNGGRSSNGVEPSVSSHSVSPVLRFNAYTLVCTPLITLAT